MLNIEKITKIISGKKILDNVSLTIKKGEIAVMLGGSGVGKSTLLRALNNLEVLDEGKVLLDGKLLDLSKNNQEHSIGMVFQGFNLFEHLTVEENITLALEHVAKKSKEEAKAIAQKLLKRYGLSDKADQYVQRLSGGQKQRLAIARTLALDPKIICLDEPTSALDPVLTNSIAKSIQELAEQGYYVLVATHDISLLERMPCTIHLMANGTIVESAPSQEFFQNKRMFSKIAAFVDGVVEAV